MLAWERMEAESARAYEAFSLYRDMGPSRSLAKVGRILGKSVGLMERWSARHSWVDRVVALEARDEMLRLEAVEEHQREKAEDFGRRQAQLYERMLAHAEKAADRVDGMLGSPLYEQRILREEDGEDVTVILMPARWSLATVKSLTDVVAGAATGRWGAPEEQEPEVEYDLSPLDMDQKRQFLELLDQIGIRRKTGP